MSRVEKLESQITELTPEELSVLRRWFIEFDSRAWDRQFESDAIAGRLDRIADCALEDHTAGRSGRL